MNCLDFDKFLSEIKLIYDSDNVDEVTDAIEKGFEHFDRIFCSDIKRDPNRANLLKLVDSQSLLKVDQVFPPREFCEQRFEYLDSGTFGSTLVFKQGRRQKEIVIKSIRCFPTEHSVSPYLYGLMTYKDTFNEVNCMLILAKLARSGFRVKMDNCKEQSRSMLFKADCFPKVNKVFLCDSTDCTFSLECMFQFTNTNPVYGYYESVIIEMEHCGLDLCTLLNDSLDKSQLESILMQVVIGLCIAECAFEFEHRDLHLSNILAQHTTQRWIRFVYKSQVYLLESNGYQAKVIDYSYSRIKYNGEVFFKHLDFLNVTNKEHIVNDGYSEMAYYVNKQWNLFSPRSNLAWIKTIVKDLEQHLNDILVDNKSPIVQYVLNFHQMASDCENLDQLFHKLMAMSSIKKGCSGYIWKMSNG